MIIQTKYKDYDMKNQEGNNGRLTKEITIKETFKVTDDVVRMICHCPTDTDELNTS